MDLALAAGSSGLTGITLGGKILVLWNYSISIMDHPPLFVYDPAKDSWSQTRPNPRARPMVIPCGIGGKLYLAGGDSGSVPPINSIPSDFVDEYDPGNDSWRPMSRLIFTERQNPACAEAGGKGYIIAGLQWRATSIQVASEVEEYDPSAEP
jgi:Kelch motif